MPDRLVKIVVAGHVCLDVIPTFDPAADGEPSVLRPGHLIHVGPAVRSTGGAVSNVGLALHRLGAPVRLIGKIGDDLFGDEIVRLLSAHGADLASGLVRVGGEVTSYSIVINPPGVDRTFLHCPGANDTFTAADVDIKALSGAGLFHFGYPPIMRRMHADGGRELAELLSRVRGAGLTVSLDMCGVDPRSEAGRVDWAALLARALPHVDLFCPSVDELLFMLDRPAFDAALADGGFDPARHIDGERLGALADRCIAMGAAVAAIKLGDQGLYLRTTADAGRLNAMGRGRPGDVSAWVDRELLSPCFAVDVAGTTGSGDCTIAGLLWAFVRGESPEAVVRSAVAVGACGVESADAVGGVPAWSEVERRLGNEWKTRPTALRLRTHTRNP